MKLLTKPKGRALPLILAAAVLLSTSPMLTGCSRGEDQPAAAPSAEPSVAPAPPPAAPPSPAAEVEPGPPPGAATADELEQLVSPIALYPDPLVAQILAGSTYPMQVVEADRWLKQNPNLTGDALAQQVNQQPWDPSIKSLTQFPSVLDTMNTSLSWTSSLGEAYYNQPADVMNAIQVMRNRALAAGTLKSTPQQTVQVRTGAACGSRRRPTLGDSDRYCSAGAAEYGLRAAVQSHQRLWRAGRRSRGILRQRSAADGSAVVRRRYSARFADQRRPQQLELRLVWRRRQLGQVQQQRLRHQQ